MEKRFFFSLFLALFTLLIGSCTNSTSTVISFDSEEFDYNYDFLSLFYYKADSELGSKEDYQFSPDTANYSKYADVANVLVMYHEMSDLFTRYYPHVYYDRLTALLNASTAEKTPGMDVDSNLTVVHVYPNGSAADEGIKKGDVILSVDSIDLEGLYSRYTKLVDSSNASSFLISLVRGTDTLAKTVANETILLPTVFLDSINKIPVVTVTEFTDSTNNPKGTAEEFKDVLEETDGATSTVIDLRGNGGGSVDICEEMAKDLLPSGDTVIIQKSVGPNKAYTQQVSSVEFVKTTTNGIGKGRYYVLLLDSNSASCTEIFAAAITSNLKSPVVGTLSFGKGIGQYYVETPDQAYGAATALHFLDKNGESYHTYGIVPDFEITNSDSAMAKAIELAKNATYKRTASYGTSVISYWQQVKSKKLVSNNPFDLSSIKQGRAFKKVCPAF